MRAISSVVCPSPLLNNNMVLILVPPRLIINLFEIENEMKRSAYIPAHLTLALNKRIWVSIWFFGCSFGRKDVAWRGMAHTTVNRKP